MLHITPYHIEAVYDMLRMLPPFSTLGLPEAEEVEFVVLRKRDRYGDHALLTRNHRIRISSANVGSLLLLEQTVAHEMIHLYQAARGMRVDHGAEFKKLARRVCKIMLWDERAFG